MKSIIVLGMHRSATSLLAESLYRLNVETGATEPSPGGHYEDVEIMQLNERILKDAGGSWHRVPPHADIMGAGEKYGGKIQRIIERKAKKAKEANRPFFGWKEPRTCLTIELFVPFLEKYEPHFVTIFRDPKKVAKSLYVRNKMPLHKGEWLAREYNTRIYLFLSKRDLW